MDPSARASSSASPPDPPPEGRPLRAIGEVALGVAESLASARARYEASKRAFIDGGGTCYRCRDRGWVAYEDDPCESCERGIARAREMQGAKLLALLQQADIATFEGRTLRTWPGPLSGLVAALDEWELRWPERQPFLLLWGPTGTGKTSLAAALLRTAMLRTGKAGWRCSAPELVRRLRPGPDQDEALAVRAERVPLLVLDDVGVTKPTEWVEERLYTIVNSRYERARWTIFTSNLSPDDGSLEDRLGARIYWRIHELALCVEVDAGNLRNR